MKKLFSVLLAVLAVVALSFGCNGADAITDPDKGRPSLTPTPGAHYPRPTPNPCGPKSSPDC